MKKKIGIYIQFVITFFVLIFGLISFFRHGFYPIFELSMGFDLLLMAYNNHVVHKNKVTILYFIFGFLLIVSGVLSVLGVM